MLSPSKLDVVAKWRRRLLVAACAGSPVCWTEQRLVELPVVLALAPVRLVAGSRRRCCCWWSRLAAAGGGLAWLLLLSPGCWLSPLICCCCCCSARRWLLDGRGERTIGEEERGATGERRKRGGEERIDLSPVDFAGGFSLPRRRYRRKEEGRRRRWFFF
ncbi:hypothetical protein KY284_029809 [Solanum tuberosum]|nr:hypothetical protein KY284_029809 [Solanum tuberosum]